MTTDDERARYSAGLDTAVELISAFMADVDNGTPGALSNDMIAAIIDDLKSDIQQLQHILAGLGTIGATVTVISSANSDPVVTPHDLLRGIADALREAP